MGSFQAPPSRTPGRLRDNEILKARPRKMKSIRDTYSSPSMPITNRNVSKIQLRNVSRVSSVYRFSIRIPNSLPNPPLKCRLREMKNQLESDQRPADSKSNFSVDGIPRSLRLSWKRSRKLNPPSHRPKDLCQRAKDSSIALPYEE